MRNPSNGRLSEDRDDLAAAERYLEQIEPLNASAMLVRILRRHAAWWEEMGIDLMGVRERKEFGQMLSDYTYTARKTQEAAEQMTRSERHITRQITRAAYVIGGLVGSVQIVQIVLSFVHH